MEISWTFSFPPPRWKTLFIAIRVFFCATFRPSSDFSISSRVKCERNEMKLSSRWWKLSSKLSVVGSCRTFFHSLCVFFSSMRITEHSRWKTVKVLAQFNVRWEPWPNKTQNLMMENVQQIVARIALFSPFAPAHTVIVIVIINCRTRTQCLECGEKLISIVEAEASIDRVRLIRRVNEQQPTAANSKSCAVGASRQAFEYGKKK